MVETRLRTLNNNKTVERVMSLSVGATLAPGFYANLLVHEEEEEEEGRAHGAILASFGTS